MDFDKKVLKNIFDTLYHSDLTLTEIICKLKSEGLTQGQTHYILWSELKDQDLFTFSGLRNEIVYAPCWSDALQQNLFLDNEFETFFKEED